MSIAAISISTTVVKTTPYTKVDRIGPVCQNALRTLASILTFPLRYLGSRTWSIPGIILRAPFILFKRIFCKPAISLKDELFGTGFRYSFEKNLTPDELQPYFPYICATAFVHGTKPEYIPPGWTSIPPRKQDFHCPSLKAEEQCFSDLKSNLKAVLLEKGDEVILSFGIGLGGALQGDTKDEEIPLAEKIHKYANPIQAIIGIHPNILEQAGEFVKELRAHPYFEGKKLILTGQCHGAAIASYAALKNELPAICWNSFPLGAGSQYALGKHKLSLADKYITHISCKGDFTSDPSLMRRTAERIADVIGIRTTGHFGRKFLIPAAYSKRSDIHMYILGSAMQHLGHNKWTQPANITS